MRVTAYALIVFFICLNLSFYIIAETEVLPEYKAPYEKPTGIESQFTNVLTLTIVTVIGAGISAIMGRFLLGATISLIIWVLGYFLPIVSWVFVGFPRFLAQMGVPEVIYVSLSALMAVVWFWFIMGVFSQRTLEA